MIIFSKPRHWVWRWAALLVVMSGFMARAYLPSTWTPDVPDHGGWDLDRQSPAEFFDGGKVVYRLITEGDHAIDNPDRQANIVNAIQTWEDVPTARIAFTRGPDISAAAADSRPGLSIGFSDSDNKTHWGQDMSGASGITLWGSTGPDGDEYFYNADICYSRTWATGDRLEATAVHEFGHAIGFLHSPEAHSTMSYIGPIRAGAGVELPRLSAGDRLGVSMTYPVSGFTGGRGSITGTIRTNQGTNVHKAQIGVFNSDGVLMLTTLSQDGRYRAGGLPAGSYTLKAFPSQSGAQLNQRASALPWTNLPATSFLALEGVGTSVAAGGSATLNLTVQAGVPSMESDYAYYSSGYVSHVLLMDRGESMRAGVSGGGFPVSLADLAGFTYTGSGLSMSSPQVGGGTVSYLTTVANDAKLGARALTIEKGNGEKNIIFGFIEVCDTGSAAIAAGPANPASGEIAAGFDHAMQQLRVAAGPEEPVRLRTWTLDTGGNGSPAPITAVAVYHDADRDGQVGGADPLLARGAHGSPTVLRTHHTVPAGESNDFLVVYSFANPAAGSTYSSSLSALRANGVDTARTLTLSPLPLSGSVHVAGAGGGIYHVVSFQAGAGGSVQSTTPQILTPGANTEAVTAIANAGYQFVNWTGSFTTTQNPLTLSNVQSDLTLTANFAALPQPGFLYRESFENGLGDWEQGFGEDGDWTRWTGDTPTAGTGPPAASDGTWYLYAGSAGGGSPGPDGVVALMYRVDLDQVPDPEISFDYHMSGSDVGRLEFQVITDSPPYPWDVPWEASGNQGTSWHPRVVDLSGYSGAVILQFVAFTDTGPQGDIAIDNVVLRTAGTGAVGTLSISPETFFESPGNLGAVAGTAVITLTGETFSSAVVSGGHVTLRNVPAGLAPVLIRDGDSQLSLTFTGNAGQHGNADDTANVAMAFGDGAFTGGNAGLVDGADGLAVAIDFIDPYKLTLELSASAVAEGAGEVPVTVMRDGPTALPLVVDLASSDPSGATVSPTVTIPAGEDRAVFNVTVVDDALIAGVRDTLITASAPAYAPAQADLAVMDDDFTLAVQHAGAGATAPAGDVVVDADDSPFAISATPGTGHHFGGWTVVAGTGVVISPQAADTAVAADSATTVQAVFTANRVAVVVEYASATVPEGGTIDVGVKLSAQPVDSLVVSVARSSGDTDISVVLGGTLLFTTSNWDAWQTVRLRAAKDPDTEPGTAEISCTGPPGVAPAAIIATEGDVPMAVQSFAVVDPTPTRDGYTNSREVDVDIRVAPGSEATHWAVTETAQAPSPLDVGAWQPLGPGSYTLDGAPGPITVYAWLRNAEGEVNSSGPPCFDEIILDFETRYHLRLAGASHADLFFGQWAGATDGFDANLDIPASGTRDGSQSHAYLQAGAIDSPENLYADFRAPGDPAWWRVVVTLLGEPVTLAWDAQPVPAGHMLILRRLQEEKAVGESYDLSVAGSLMASGEAVFGITLGTPRRVAVPLAVGWNLLGQPHTGMATEQRAAPTRVWQWDGNSHRPADFADGIPQESGFWMLAATVGQEVVFEGMPADGMVELLPGWNLVAPGVAATCPDGIAPVWQWLGEENHFSRVSSGDAMSAGRAYWIWSEQRRTVLFPPR